MKETAYSVYNYNEIIERYLAETAPLDGPSCFPVTIKFEADNMTEPPVITCEVFTVTQGKWNHIFSDGVDQNTTLSHFQDSLRRLRKMVLRAFRASNGQIPYEELLKEELGRKEEDTDYIDDTPF